MTTLHKIDAKGMKLGRLATVVAMLLMGKDTPAFRKNLAPISKVEILNASKIDITPKKMAEISHVRYSGYPGGKTETKGRHVITKKGYEELLRHAVSGMIPKNKHHSNMLKNLIVNE
ncbi:MAG: uL13 family ribosomal protein, partial [bacterium]|nr:uL13 family ribosomal protein [bacterium]